MTWLRYRSYRIGYWFLRRACRSKVKVRIHFYTGVDWDELDQMDALLGTAQPRV